MRIDISKDESRVIQLALGKLRGCLEEEIETSYNKASAIDQLNKCDDLFMKLTESTEI